MQIKDLIDELCLFDGHYKSAQVEEALQRQEEIVPHLLEILEAVLVDPQLYMDDEGFFGHQYALMLLGHFGEQQAHRTIVNIFSLPDDLPSLLFAETVTEDLPGILLNTCGGRFDLIKTLAQNRKADEFCRGSALRAIAYGVVSGQLDRMAAIAFFQELLENCSGEPVSTVFAEAACCLLDLYPEESMKLIEQAYVDGLIHPGYVEFDAFEKQLKRGREDTLENLATVWEHRNPADFHARMAWWACFEQSSPMPYRVTRAATEKRAKKKKKAKRKTAKASKRKRRKRKKK